MAEAGIDGCKSCNMASTAARDGKGFVGSLEAELMVTVGGVGIRDDRVVPVFTNAVDDVRLCISTAEAKEAVVVGDDSGGVAKISTGGMRLLSSVAIRMLLTRDGCDKNLTVVLCAVLTASLDGLPLIWIRDAKERLD